MRRNLCLSKKNHNIYKKNSGASIILWVLTTRTLCSDWWSDSLQNIAAFYLFFFFSRNWLLCLTNSSNTIDHLWGTDRCHDVNWLTRYGHGYILLLNFVKSNVGYWAIEHGHWSDQEWLRSIMQRKSAGAAETGQRDTQSSENRNEAKWLWATSSKSNDCGQQVQIIVGNKFKWLWQQVQMIVDNKLKWLWTTSSNDCGQQVQMIVGNKF